MRRSDAWAFLLSKANLGRRQDGATRSAGVVTHCSPSPTPALMTTTLSTDLPAETVRASFDALLEGRPASAVIGGPNARSLLGLISRVDGLRSRTPSSVVTVTFESDTTQCVRWACPDAPVDSCALKAIDHCWYGGRSGGFASCTVRPGDVDATKTIFDAWDAGRV